MKAAFWYGNKDIRVMDTEKPTADADEVVVKVKRCGICGTDLHEYTDGPQVTWETPHPLTGDTAPVILGHEFSGEITEVGSDVKTWKIGDRVAIMPILYCGKCDYCRQGLQHLCADFGCTGLQWHWGGFAEYCKAKEYQLNRIPDNVTYEQAASLEPMAVAMHGVHRSGLKAGDTLFISGGGPIGVLTLMAAKAAGASRIYMSETAPKRLARLKELGATEVFNAVETDVVAEVKARTNGIGTDVTIDCSGKAPAINDCLKIVKRRGTHAQTGLTVGETSLKSMFDFSWDEATIAGVWCYNVTDFQSILDLMGSGALPDIDKVVTKVIPIEKVVDEGFETLTKDQDGSELKIQVSFE